MLKKTLTAHRRRSTVPINEIVMLHEAIIGYARSVSPEDAAALIKEAGGWPEQLGQAPFYWDAAQGVWIAQQLVLKPSGKG